MNCIKALRLSWFGHADQMTNNMVIKNLYEWKPLSTRLAGRPKSRLENGIKEDLFSMKANNWTKSIQDQVKWREVVEKAKTFKH
jgi:hypothetical protein